MVFGNAERAIAQVSAKAGNLDKAKIMLFAGQAFVVWRKHGPKERQKVDFAQQLTAKLGKKHVVPDFIYPGPGDVRYFPDEKPIYAPNDEVLRGLPWKMYKKGDRIPLSVKPAVG